jgi:hypothetical protein
MTTQRMLAGFVALLLLGPLAVRGDDKPDYTDLSKRVQEFVIPQVPKQWEDTSEWGKSIPIPDKLRFPGLRRMVVKKGDKDEFPHGTWRYTKLWLDDPAKDVRIEIKEIRKLDSGPYRVKVDATVALHGFRQRQQWQNGFKLLDISAQADALTTIALELDVKISLNVTKFPPEALVEPKVADIRLVLKQFDLNRVGPVGGELIRELGNELKGIIQAQMTMREPEIKDLANKAIAKGIAEGKGKFSAASLLKMNGPTKKTD